MNKFELVRNIIAKQTSDNLSLLDVGCRGCELKKYVHDLVRYNGADLFQNAEGSVDFVQDIEKGLPLSDASYDFVVALDLVEHLNDIQGGLEELLRITRHKLIVMLPNVAYISFRKDFFLHGSFSKLTDKYSLTYGMGADRHRWLTVLPQMDEYMRNFAADKQLQIETTWFNDSDKKLLFEKLGRLIGLAPSWWVWASLYTLTKSK